MNRQWMTCRKRGRLNLRSCPNHPEEDDDKAISRKMDLPNILVFRNKLRCGLEIITCPYCPFQTHLKSKALRKHLQSKHLEFSIKNFTAHRKKEPFSMSRHLLAPFLRGTNATDVVVSGWANEARADTSLSKTIKLSYCRIENSDGFYYLCPLCFQSYKCKKSDENIKYHITSTHVFQMIVNSSSPNENIFKSSMQ